jgi:hypothetical protein
MKVLPSFLVTWLFFLPGHTPAADNQLAQTVIAAAQKLAQQDNYSWISSSQAAPGTRSWRQGPTKGQTEKNGSTYVTFTLGDNTISMGFNSAKAAINWSDQWREADELKGEYAWIGQRLKTYKPPAQEAVFLAQHATNLKAQVSDTFSGQLDGAALKWLLSRGRQEFTDIPNMKGSVTFKLHNHQLIQYVYKVQGTLPLNPDQPEVQINRTTKVEIHKVGGTQVTVPAEAAEKLR